MYVQVETLDFQFAYEAVDFALEGVGEEDGRLDDTRAETGGACLLDGDVHSRAYALACNLHQSEFAQGEDVVLGAVALHVLAHPFVELLAILCCVHVDEIDNDDAAHVAQPKLSGQFVGSAQVHLDGVHFLVGASVRTVAAIDVDGMEGFGMVDDEVGTTLVGHDASERGLDLLGDAEIVEDGEVARVELDHLFAVGGNQGDVVVYLAEDVFIVHID